MKKPTVKWVFSGTRKKIKLKLILIEQIYKDTRNDIFIYPLQNNFKHFFRVPEKFFNFLERKNMSKNLDNHTSRAWDLRVAQELGNLNAALIHGQVLHHHGHMGEFSKSNNELAQELNLNPQVSTNSA